jgi:hypothetical protein
MHLRHGIIMAQVHDDLGEATDFGVHLSTSALRGTLRERGLRWGRPRLAMPLKVDPAKARIQWLLAKAVVEAGPEAAILYADASRL